MKHVDANDELMAGTFEPTFERLHLEETGFGETVANLWGSVGRCSEEDSSCWLTHEPAPRPYLLSTPAKLTGHDATPARGVLPLGKVGMLAAAGGVGKSWALAQLALSVATGRPWFGTYDVTTPGHVLMAMGEEERLEVRRRLYCAAQAMNLTNDEIAKAKERVFVLPLCGKPVCLTQEPNRGDPIAMLGNFGDTSETGFALAVREHLLNAGHPWRLVIFDPLSRFAGPNAEVDNSAATRFVQALERFAEVPGTPTVLVAHHTNKMSRNQKEDHGAGAARGASALSDGVRWQANLEPVAQGDDEETYNVEMRVTKSNYAMRPPSLMLVRDARDFGALRAATEVEVEEASKRSERAAIEKAVKKREDAAKIKDLAGARMASNEDNETAGRVPSQEEYC